jgi:signal transduction histidine kinase
VVSEALANGGKYSKATKIDIRADAIDGLLILEIADDGIGGADPTAGTGLRGLVDRVEALGGHLLVTSPAGAGTVVTADLPCGSDGDAAMPR